MSNTNTKASPSQGIRVRKLRLFAVLMRKIAWALLPAVLVFGALGLSLWVLGKMEEPKRCREQLEFIVRLKTAMAKSYEDNPDALADVNAFFEDADFYTCPSTGQRLICNKIGEAPVCPSGRWGHRLSEISGRDGGAKR